MRIKHLLTCLLAGALGLGLTACGDDDSNNTPVCGNGILETGEACDGIELNSQTCITQGREGGTLACAGNCTFDLSGCTGSAGCGDGELQVGEVCDGTNLDGVTCEDQGLVSGTLACSADCTSYVTTGCEDPVTDCTPDESVSLSHGSVVVIEVDTATESDSGDVSCEEGGSPAAERLVEIVLDADGDLAVTSSGDWHIFALFPDNACFSSNAEIGCHDPYTDGPTGVFSGLSAGTYYLAVSDWNDQQSGRVECSLGFYPAGGEICNNATDDDGDGLVDCDDSDCDTVPFCMAENCTNGVDDDLNGAADCADFTCLGTAGCVGGVCVADTDLGVISSSADATATFDTSAASHTYDLSCGTAGNAEHVVAFTLAATSLVSVAFTQSTSDANVLSFNFEGPAGNTCADQEYFCIVPTSTDIGGLLTTDPLPPANYYFIVEANNGGGPVTTVFSVDLYCPPGQHNENGSCVANACQATDLGTFGGTLITAQGDSCTGTYWYGANSLACTGWPAGAEELVYSVTIPAGTTVNITQTPTGGATQDTSLYVLTTCEDWLGATCVAGADDTLGGEAETLSYTNSATSDRLIYIIADSYSGCGTFDLTIQ